MAAPAEFCRWVAPSPPIIFPGTRIKTEGDHQTAISSARGCRDAMEDVSCAHTFIFPRSSVQVTLLAVFDGHNGSAISVHADRCVKTWVDAQRRSVRVPSTEELQDSLVSLVETMHTSIPPDMTGGSTATLVLVTPEHVVCVNVGDSPAILLRRDKTFVKLHTDHNASNADECARLQDLGLDFDGEGRLQGTLNMSRAIGDREHADKGLLATPSVSCTPRSTQDVLVLVASDGMVDTKPLVHWASMALSCTNPCDASFVTARLVSACLDPLDLASDNVSIVVQTMTPKLSTLLQTLEAEEALERRMLALLPTLFEKQLWNLLYPLMGGCDDPILIYYTVVYCTRVARAYTWEQVAVVLERARVCWPSVSDSTFALILKRCKMPSWVVRPESVSPVMEERTSVGTDRDGVCG
jgi:serine/threonine protein phosphatase PrpC